jgi:hypothetical protein
MILNTSFFGQTGNTYSVAFTATSATITIPKSQEVFNNLRITNNSGNLCFMQVATTDPTTINHPTPGASGSTQVFAVPTGSTTFINTGITSPANVYISTISISGTGNVFLQTGSFI